MQRTLITIGLLIAPAGVLWPWIAKLGLGRLPGDLIIDKPGFELFTPLTAMIVVSEVRSRRDPRPGRRPAQVARRTISV